MCPMWLKNVLESKLMKDKAAITETASNHGSRSLQEVHETVNTISGSKWKRFFFIHWSGLPGKRRLYGSR